MEKIGEDLQLLIFSYLNVTDLINFCYVSRYYRKLMLKRFEKYYNLAIGLCSIYLWTNVLEDNIWGLIENIYNELNDFYAFGFELDYDGLFKEFRHLSLFSVCQHFSSCETRFARYCKICSRVRDNTFFEYNAFLSIQLREEDGYLYSTEERADLDVFLSQPAYFPYAVCESCRTCNERQVLSHTQDLIVAFCSVLVRIYLDITMNYFSTLISQISLVHEKTVIGKITWAAKLLLFRFFKLNQNFFLDFFYLFNEVNRSECYVMFEGKPKYCPYDICSYTLEVSMF